MSFRILNPWDCLRGKSCKVEYPAGVISEYGNLWQFLNRLRGKSFVMALPDSYARPDLETCRSQVAADPASARARLELGACLHTAGALEEAYAEYKEAIALLSVPQDVEDPGRSVALRAFARRMAAKVLEQMGREAEAREQWRRCAEDWRTAVPQERYLRENPQYLEAIEKQAAAPT